MTLELTETVLMENPERSKRVLRDIKRLNEGIRIAVDDFGTGYSSLSYLTQFSVDSLKIDRSFVLEMDQEISRKVIRTIIDLGESLDLNVIAEGVETEDQFRQLREHNCRLFQGYYLSRPLEFSDLKELLGRSTG